jgi:hypothetical protein
MWLRPLLKPDPRDVHDVSQSWTDVMDIEMSYEIEDTVSRLIPVTARSRRHETGVFKIDFQIPRSQTFFTKSNNN